MGDSGFGPRVRRGSSLLAGGRSPAALLLQPWLKQ